MKKILKITGITILIVLLILIAAPFLFKGSLEDLVKKTINENLNATVAWEDLDLSLLKSFPDAALTINNFSIVNNTPFAGDTLASGATIKIDMGIRQLFKKSDEAIKVNALHLDKAYVHIKTDSLGNSNYNIAKKDESTVPSEEESEPDSGFSFDLNAYEISDSNIHYSDDVSGTYLLLKDVNHEGKGDLSASVSQLETETNAIATFRMGDTEYLSENAISLIADFQLDLENNTYTFLENEAKINALPLTFDGYVKTNENSSEIDLKFNTPSSDFKNFLGVIPKKYVKELDGVTTTGNFAVDGTIKGIVDENLIPKMDISIASDNASFKYPNLPKTVENISIDARLKNETGLVKDTYITIGGVTFKIDDEIFNASGSIRNITENALINLALKGTLDLANIEKVLPMQLEQDLSGVFSADVVTNFDMRSVDQEQYENIKSTGTASLTGFSYADEAFKDKIEISKAAVTLAPGNIRLDEFNATSGQTDMTATGDIQNLIPWIMAKQDLKGRFNVVSNTFNVNDFMSVEEAASGNGSSTGKQADTSDDSVKIPDFLDATLDFSAKKVIYDNIVLDNAKGTVGIKDEAANLSNVTSEIFGGNVALSGNVSTLNETPTFAMNMDLQDIDIDQSFQNLDLLKYIAPLAKALQGNINTTLALRGDLNENLTPDLATIAGNALAQILTAEVNPEQTPLLATLSDKLAFLNLDKLSLQDLSTAITFNNGSIEVAPFDVEVEGVNMTIGGSHGLDKNINYNVVMDVPAKYMGTEVTKLLAKIDPQEANEMTVSLPVGLTGSFTNPKVNVNTKGAVNGLTKKLIDKQKNDLIDKGTNILNDIIDGNNTPKDTTNTDGNTTQGTPNQGNTTQVIKDVIGDIFGNKKKTDTTKTDN